jgi:hypothetical protein
MNIRRHVMVTTSIILLVLFAGTSLMSAENQANPKEKYTYTSDWFSHNIPTWTRVLAPLKGKPNLTYLEIGPYEGRSFLWVMDNILTHPTSRAVAIDTFDKIFDSDPEKHFTENLRRSGRLSSVKIIKGFSQEKLRGLPLNSFDLIYIDGDHRSKGVIMDTILSWDLLKEGGILIFDDYKLNYDLPMEARPEFPLDVFLTLFRDEFKVLVKDYQLIVRKAKVPCNEAMGYIKRMETPLICSRLGSYTYYWKPQKLYDTESNRQVALTKDEISIIEKTLTGRKLGFRLEAEPREMGRYRDLFERLGITEVSVAPKER